MKNIYIFSCLMTLLFFRLSPAAGGWIGPSTFLGHEIDEQFHACAKAIQADNIGGFEASFSRNLLPLYAVVVCEEDGKFSMRPMGLIHFAAYSRGHHANQIIKSLLDAGANPDMRFSSVRPRIDPTNTDEQERMRDSEEYINGLTPLDIAVARANVPVVGVLLKNNAHPYKTALLSQTSNVKAIAKEIICFAGENPLIHACAYLKDAQEKAEESCADKEWSGTKEEYIEIIQLLHNAQTWYKLKLIDGWCSVL